MGTDLLSACAIVTAMLVALAGLGKAGQWLVSWMRKLARLADDLTGEPPRAGLPEGRPGLLDRMSSMEEGIGVLPAMREQLADAVARLAALEAQMKPNGGSSLRDAVDKLAPQTDSSLAA